MGKQKVFTGTVVSDKMQKTVVVRILRMSKHPQYGKVLKTYAKFKAHDEAQTAKMGDVVRIVETRPLSKDKRFRVVAVVRKGELAHIEIKPESGVV